MIAAGGGGIPLCGEEGVEAVVDKDLAAAELAIAVGADRILSLTAVDGAKLRFGLPSEEDLDLLTVSEAERYLAEGHFAPGTMGPKIEGAIRFLRATGRGEVLITTPERVLAGYRGEAGTRIVPGRGESRRPVQAGTEAAR